MNTAGPTGKLLITVFAAFAQFEREMMLEDARGASSLLVRHVDTSLGLQ